MDILWKLVSFFTNDVDPAALEDVNVAASARFKELQEQTRDQLMIALKNQKTFGLKFNISVGMEFLDNICRHQRSLFQRIVPITTAIFLFWIWELCR